MTTIRRCGPTTADMAALMAAICSVVSASAASQTWAGVMPSPMSRTVTRDEPSRVTWRPAVVVRAALPASRSERWSRPPSIDRTRCRTRPPSVAPSRAHRSGSTCQPTVTPPAASAATPVAERPAGTVRTRASAVPQESSWSSGAAACAPSAAAWWSWPAVVSTAPTSRATPQSAPARPSAVPEVTRGANRPVSAPDQSTASVHQSRAARSSQPVRDASDASEASSPPSPRTTHSAMLRRRTAVAAAGSVSSWRRCLVSDHCDLSGSPVVVLNVAAPRSCANRSTSG